MNKSAVIHIPMSQYAFPLSEDKFTIRIRTASGDLDECTLFYGDRAYPHTPMAFSKAHMNMIFFTKEYDMYEYTIEECPSRLCYFFELKSDGKKVYYYADRFHDSLADVQLDNGAVLEGRSEYYQYPIILKSEIIQIPRWFINSRVYNIFPDSFANGKRLINDNKLMITDEDGNYHNSCHGGTIRGITENLDYIKQMGFNCVYLNPIFSAGEYHKYDILDYYNIDPMLGTNDDFRILVEEAHSLGMHVIIDGVFNHCSWYFFAFDDVVKNGKLSRYSDWFYDIDYPVSRPQNASEKPQYACFAYERKMPKLNTSNEEVQEYFSDVGVYWINKYHIDGWRLDVANEVDKNFWRKFRNKVKKANSEAILIGEVWENARSWLEGDMFDSVMNYDFRNICRNYFAFSQINESEFAGEIMDMLLRYPKQTMLSQLNLLDSHDVARFLSLCKGDADLYRCAMCFMFMMPGVPDVFYGDEKEICGTDEQGYRAAMNWNDFNDDEEYISKLSTIREKYIDLDSSFKIGVCDDVRHILSITWSGKRSIEIIFCKSELKKDELVNAEDKILLAYNFNGEIMQKNSCVILEK